MRIPCLHPGKRRSGYFVFLLFWLEHWELDYYRTHRAVVELRGVESAEEQAEKRRLLALLGGQG